MITIYDEPNRRLVVEYISGGEYDFAHGPASEGVEYPDDATVIAEIITGDPRGTIHITHEPAWTDYYGEAA